MPMFHRIILLLVLLAFYPFTGDAKCSVQKYYLAGRIAAGTSAAQGIRVYPFLEGAEVTGIVPNGTETPSDFAVPDSEGSFAIELWLNTDSGTSSSGRDDCNRKAKYADLFIVGEGIGARRVQVAFKWAKGKVPRGDAGIIRVERVER